MKILIRLGGSVIATPVNTGLIGKYVEILKELKAKGHKLVVVVGGGALAREFIQIAKELELEEKDQDDLAISVSRLFAQLFIKKLGKISCEKIPLSVEEAVECFEEGKIAVLGGLKPGMTTDTVAALIAERIDADMLIKATDQEGVYDKDPRKYPDAVKLDKLRFEELPQVLAEKKHRAGIRQILDPEAVKVLKAKRIKVLVLNGYKPENILLAVEGKNVGTLIE
ncbi:MAG: UMP kinase [Candidatus Bathyarchaeota archaeon]|nr:UMP kinase [Candidatus Bathyarchaeota archaeon]MCX8177043.1 UMP kinase [Candidatus Bathyarchaeota archaeon]MDW8194218.1 UMP kinase [Nitrososphaerota archaeon]